MNTRPLRQSSLACIGLLSLMATICVFFGLVAIFLFELPSLVGSAAFGGAILSVGVAAWIARDESSRVTAS